MKNYTIFSGVNGAGKRIISNIKLAKEKGFYVTMNYIGIESVNIANK